MTKTKDSSRTPEETEDFKKKFGELPLNEKLSTLMHLEVATMSEAVNTIIEKSISVGENVMDKLGNSARPTKDSD
jgi:hypothetical protein